MVSERQSQFELSSSEYQPSYEYTGATLLDPEADVAFNLGHERLLPLEEARQRAANAPVVERQRSKQELQLEVIQSVNRNIAAMRRDRLGLAA